MSELPNGNDAETQRVGRRSWGPSAEDREDDQTTRPLHYAARAAESIADEDSDDEEDDATPRPRGRRASDDADDADDRAGEDGAEGREPAADSGSPKAADDRNERPRDESKPTDEADSDDRNRIPADRPGGDDARDEHQADSADADQAGKDRSEDSNDDQSKREQPGDEDRDRTDEDREKTDGDRDETLYRRPAPATQRPETVKVEAQDQARVPAPVVAQPTAPAPVTNQPTMPAPSQPAERRYSAGDLIEQLTPSAPERSTRGWRARFGMPPSQREADELRDLQAVKTAFRRPVTILVANPKGGSGKTPISVLLAAAFGQTRGGGVVAWDNNELRGTLPDRTISAHRRNVHDLLEHLDQLRWSTSQFTDLAHFLNRQDSGNFYTLGSAQNAGHVVTGQNFRQVHELFARYFQIIVVDTGNNEAAPNWTAAAGEADCLVVPTKWRKDSLIPAARMLESLQDTNPGLLERTVIAATNGPMDSQKDVKSNGASWFGSSHPIVDIPIDPHIAEGGQIDYALLRESTRRAAVRLAAEVATRLIEGGHAE